MPGRCLGIMGTCLVSGWGEWVLAAWRPPFHPHPPPIQFTAWGACGFVGLWRFSHWWLAWCMTKPAKPCISPLAFPPNSNLDVRVRLGWCVIGGITSVGQAMALYHPTPNSSLVGGQVVGTPAPQPPFPLTPLPPDPPPPELPSPLTPPSCFLRHGTCSRRPACHQQRRLLPLP